MIIQKLIISPDSSGYNFLDGQEVLSVQLDGGMARYRSDVLNSSTKMVVQWSLNGDDYNYIRDFYKNVTKSGALPFLMDVMLNDGFELTECNCHFVPGTFGLKSQQGLGFVVGATIELTNG